MATRHAVNSGKDFMLLNRLSLKDLPPHAISLAADVVLVSLPADTSIDDPLPFRSCPPYGTVDVLGSAGAHQLAAMRLVDPDQVESSSEGTDRQNAFPVYPIVIGNDICDLAADLDDQSRLRLLNFLLGFCRKAFELANNSDFARSCLDLSRLVLSRAGNVQPIAKLTDRWTLLSGDTFTSNAALWAIGQGRVRRLTILRPDDTLPLTLTEHVDAADTLLSLGERAALYSVGPNSDNFSDLLKLQSEHSALRKACLRAVAQHCPETLASLREQAIYAALKPSRVDDLSKPVCGALEAALPDGKGKIFLRGWLHDPLNLIASIALGEFGTTTSVDSLHLHRFHRPDLEKQLATAAFPTPGNKAGFIAYIPDDLNGLTLQPTLLISLKSGAQIALRSPLLLPSSADARTAVLTSVQPSHVTESMLETCLGPAAASFHRATLNERGEPETITIGQPVSNPHTSVIIPLYRNLNFLRFQFSAFAADPTFRNVELIYVLDSPEQKVEVEHLLWGLYSTFELSSILLVMPRNLGYACATNAGGTFARAPALLLLNSDVIPDQAGWLEQLHAALDYDEIGAVGPKLLFDDESIQHAGLYFARGYDQTWSNSHYYKGMPRYWPDANVAREVPGLTGAAMLVKAAEFKRIGGICEDYIIGDYEDSDFCLRLRQRGMKTRYVPGAELFHFERKSISMHGGYAGTLACRYNRDLHHSRWNDSITELMAEPLQSPTAPCESA